MYSTTLLPNRRAQPDDALAENDSLSQDASLWLSRVHDHLVARWAKVRIRSYANATPGLRNIAWFAGLYGLSVMSFGAMVVTVRWTLALV